MSHHKMNQSTLSKSCPFCNNAFKKLGNHLAHCPDRNGRDYNYLLSQKTLDNRSGKKPKKTCPKCGRKISRLSTHLRSSAICKDTQTISPAPFADPIPAVTSSLSLPPHQFQPPQPASPPPLVTILPRMKLPQTAEGWSEADEFIKQFVVPRVLHEMDVNVMNHALCAGIYSYFTTKYGMASTHTSQLSMAHWSSINANTSGRCRN